MRWLNTAWPLVRDILMTGLGIWLIVKTSLSLHPNDAVLAVGVGLLAPAAIDKTQSILAGPAAGGRPSPSPGGSPTSGSAPPQPAGPEAPPSPTPPPPSSSPQE